MFITIINDCRDDNARSRQESRVASLTGITPSFIGVDSDIEAGMQLIDTLDATEGRDGLILVNVAPRGGHTKKWENGTPFAYLKYKDTLIISTIDGFVLSGIKQFTDTATVNLLNIHDSTTIMQKAGFVEADAVTNIPDSQFRSFDFTPRAGVFLMQGNELPSKPYSIEHIPTLPSAVWHIDNFGNCKTTLTPETLSSNKLTETRFGVYQYIPQLKDLQDNSSALIRGSSGLGKIRLLEFATQRGNFATIHNVTIGDDIFEKNHHSLSARIL